MIQNNSNTSNGNRQPSSAINEIAVGTNSQEQIANLDAQIGSLADKTANSRQMVKWFLIVTLILLGINLAAPALLGTAAIFLQVTAGFLSAVTGMVWLLGLAVTGTYQAQLEGLYRRKDELLQLSGLISTSPESSYFDQLVKINVHNLGEYYTLMKGHTNKSFLASLGVAVAGFALIAAGLSYGFLNSQTTPPIAYIASGAGILTEFIAAAFFFLYSKTVRQLKEYHDSLLAVQNMLLSFKIIGDIQDGSQKADMVALMLGNLTGKGVVVPSVRSKQDDTRVIKG